jgi:hypothetical protein
MTLREKIVRCESNTIKLVRRGFDAAAHLILAEAQKLVNALEDSDCKCDYPTMFCCDRCRALKAWNEFLNGGEDG